MRIGILKGLFGWTAKDQRPCGGVNLRTLPSDLREFTLRVGSEWPLAMDQAQPCTPLWRGGCGTGQRERDGSGTRVLPKHPLNFNVLQFFFPQHTNGASLLWS